MERDTKKAFLWIVGLLKKYEIPFHISGGMAAQLYGAKRELAGIDIEIPEQQFDRILTDVKQYITFGPARYFEDMWDLKLLTLNYAGQEIDVAGAFYTKILNTNTNKWEILQTHFETDVIMNIYGMAVPVISKQELIEYKQKLKREVDIKDIEEMTRID